MWVWLLTLTSLWFTIHNSLATHGTGSVHRIFATQTSKAGLTKNVFARVNFVGLVQQIETNGTNQSVIKIVKLGFGFENILKGKVNTVGIK